MFKLAEFHAAGRACIQLGAALSMLVCTDVGLSAAANAETFTSVYTSTAAKDCRKGH